MSPSTTIVVVVAAIGAGWVMDRLRSRSPALEPRGSGARVSSAPAGTPQGPVYALRWGSVAALLPLARVFVLPRAPRSDPDDELFDEGHVIVDASRKIAVDLRALTRIMPFVANELALLRQRLEEATLDLVYDVPGYLKEHGIRAADLHLPAAWLEGVDSVRNVESVPYELVLRLPLRFDETTITLYGTRDAYLARVRHGLWMEGAVSELARKLGREPLIDEAEPAALVARVTAKDGTDRLFRGDLSASALETLAEACATLDDPSLLALLRSDVS